MIQLYEVMMTRHTTMVVGQTGGGKTVIINTLAKAQVGVFLWMGADGWAMISGAVQLTARAFHHTS